MAVLKTRGAAALSGAAGGARDFLDRWLQYKHQDQIQKQQNDFVTQRELRLKREGAADKAEESIRSGTTRLEDYPDLAPILSMRLPANPGPSQDERMAKVIPAVGADTTDSQIDSLIAANHAVGHEPMQFTGNGPSLPPENLQAMDARDQARSALATKGERESGQKYQDSYATHSGENDATNANASTATANKVDEATALQPVTVKTAGLVAGATEDAKNDPVRQRAAARGAGLTAGAESDATTPNAIKVAEARANANLLSQKEMQDYRREHPAMPANLVLKHHQAESALQSIDTEIKPMLAEMEKRGMLGPMAGRLEDLASGKVKSSELFSDPESAQLAARFMSSAKLLTSLVANVHAGQRGAAGKDSMNYFKGIFSGIGDKPIIEGQLGAISHLMQIYSEKPDTPENFPIPGMDLTSSGAGPGGGNPASRFINRPGAPR